MWYMVLVLVLVLVHGAAGRVGTAVLEVAALA
jgi:NADPH:quinone reductase-like Zn-dependent oxidoreductase